MSPSRYIVKVDRATGAELPDPIEPAELLVHAHRDKHPIEIAAQFLASRLIQVSPWAMCIFSSLKIPSITRRHGP